MKFDYNKRQVVVKEYRLEEGIVQVFDNHLITLFNDGATLNLEEAYQIIGIAEIHFRDKNFGIVSLRRNSFAIDPTVYTYFRGLNNLKAFAIVSRREIDMHNFPVEQMFFKKNMKFFIQLENAVNWIKTAVKNSKLDSLKEL